MKGLARMVCALVAATALVVPAPALAAQPVSQVRLAGTSRYDTMAGIVRMGFPGTCDWAVVATGANYPDALAASALAGARACPVILTDSSQLSAQASAQLRRLGVKNVYLMGGEGAISAEVEKAITQATGAPVSRIAGTNRVQTSVEAFNEVRSIKATSDTVVIATSHGYADALSVGPYCYASSSPLLLTQGDGTLSTEAVEVIKHERRIRRAVVVGGVAAVSPQVETQLAGLEVVRLEGKDRYATSKAIVEWEVRHGLGWSSVGVATGRVFPDALAGAALLGSVRSPLLLANSTHDSTISLIQSNRLALEKAYVLGGPNAVSDSLAAAAVGVPLGANDEARQAFEPILREEASQAASEGEQCRAYYRYANIYGDDTDELLCVTKDTAGSDWTLQVHTYANGMAHRMLKLGFYGDISYRFYIDTGLFELSRAGHGGESVTYCVADNGTYRVVGTKARKSTQGGAATDGEWIYTYGSQVVLAADFQARIQGLERGSEVVLGPSSEWEQLSV